MKLTDKIIATIASMMMLSSCNLDYAPENQLVDENVYKNERTAQAALMGCYVRLNVFISGASQDQNNYANSGDTYMYGDIGTDNLNARPSSNSYMAMEKSSYTSSEHDGILYNIWHWGYNAIDYTNNVIAGVSKYGTYHKDTRLRHIAEAKFIRSYIYFQLLCMFGDKALLGNDNGPGLIMRLDPYSGYNPDNIQSRESNARCWEQIISDLNQAIPDLPDETPAIADRIRANKTVARALLSRIYLYKGTYSGNTGELEKARDLAIEVLSAPGYSFQENVGEYTTALFPSNEYSQSDDYPDPTTRSNELIFFQPSRISTDAYPNGLYYYRKSSFYVSAEMKSYYDADDVRASDLIWQGSKSDHADDLTSKKYSAEKYCDVIYIRLAEIKLTYAETLARLSGSISEEALTQLNAVHMRAYPDDRKPIGYKASDFTSVDDFIKTVLIERNKELAYEGHNRYDIMRTGNMTGDSKMAAVPSEKWNMPIPEYEIRISYGTINQNSGYSGN